MNKHIPVLLNEVIEGLAIQDGEIILDATLGGGGHSLSICKRFGDHITQFAIDEDAEAIEQSNKLFDENYCRVTTFVANFRDMDTVLAQSGITQANKIFFDLGLRSDQFDSGRGFSFQRNDPLIMTYERNAPEERLIGSNIVNDWDEENIELILRVYGEERFSRRIAKKIVEAREIRPIRTTHELTEIISRAVPKFYHFKKIHPATKTFQALRIAVNDEIQALKEGLVKAFHLLAPTGRIAVISFQSLEDREVKRFFHTKEKTGEGRRITKKPIVPKAAEISHNPRARSAKLRIFEKN